MGYYKNVAALATIKASKIIGVLSSEGFKEQVQY
jgi:hypothetical protein